MQWTTYLAKKNDENTNGMFHKSKYVFTNVTLDFVRAERQERLPHHPHPYTAFYFATAQSDGL